MSSFDKGGRGWGNDATHDLERLRPTGTQRLVAPNEGSRGIEECVIPTRFRDLVLGEV